LLDFVVVVCFFGLSFASLLYPCRRETNKYVLESQGSTVKNIGSLFGAHKIMKYFGWSAHSTLFLTQHPSFDQETNGVVVLADAGSVCPVWVKN
jgi:hypothetical protein